MGWRAGISLGPPAPPSPRPTGHRIGGSEKEFKRLGGGEAEAQGQVSPRESSPVGREGAGCHQRGGGGLSAPGNLLGGGERKTP